jgi:hypothetical protein
VTDKRSEIRHRHAGVPNQSAAANGGGPSQLQPARLVAAVAELESLAERSSRLPMRFVTRPKIPPYSRALSWHLWNALVGVFWWQASAQYAKDESAAIWRPENGMYLDMLGVSARLRGSAISKHTIQMAGVMTCGRLMSNGMASRTLYCSFPSNTISLMQIVANNPYQTH